MKDEYTYWPRPPRKNGNFFRYWYHVLFKFPTAKARQLKRAARYVLIMVCLCLIAVQIVLLPSFTKTYDFTSEAMSNLGTALSGLTGPIIGIISIVLLYITLNNQIVFNKHQSDKNEFDNLLRLIEELESEIASFKFIDINSNIRSYVTGEQAFSYCLLAVQRDGAKPGFSMSYLSGELNMILDLALLIRMRVFAGRHDNFTSYLSMKLDLIVRERMVSFLGDLSRMAHQSGVKQDRGMLQIHQFLKLFDYSWSQTWRPESMIPKEPNISIS